MAATCVRDRVFRIGFQNSARQHAEKINNRVSHVHPMTITHSAVREARIY